MSSRTKVAHWKKIDPRRGAIVVAVLACMIIVMGILLPSVPAALRARREVRTDAAWAQCHFLLRAASVRGIEALTKDSKYTGEDWRPDLGVDSEYTAHVAIRFSPEPSHSQFVNIKVTLEPIEIAAMPNIYSHSIVVEEQFAIKQPNNQ